MILSDRTIKAEVAAGRIVIDPFDEQAVQPSSVDLRIDRQFLVFRNHTATCIDPHMDQPLAEPVVVEPDGVFTLHPGEFVLGSTVETIGLPDDLVARLEGKSSLGRLGLLIHSTAGFVDAGWYGQLTLELSNAATLPIKLHPGMKIGQISFLRMTTAADNPYGSDRAGSKYQGQRGPVPSRYWQNEENWRGGMNEDGRSGLWREIDEAERAWEQMPEWVKLDSQPLLDAYHQVVMERRSAVAKMRAAAGE